MSRTLFPEFQASAARHADRVAVRDEDVSLTYTELEALGRRVGKSLLALGIRKGDTAALWAVNQWRWIAAGLGIQAAGGVLIPCGTRLRGREVAINLSRVSTRIMFADASFGSYDFVAAILAEDLPALEHVIVFHDRPHDGRVMGWPAFLAAGDGVSDEALDAAIAAVRPDDLADILFTSGTTGVPKGVPIEQQQSLIACDVQQTDVCRFTADDVFAVTFPFAHNAGYRAGWQISLLHGVTIVPVRNYDSLSLLQMIDREKVTVLPGAPPVYQAILDHPDRERFDLSSMRIASTGGTTVPMRLIERMQELFGREAVSTGYGMTETAGSATNTRPDDPARVIVETAGRPLSNIELKILDPDHREVPPGERGEIAIRGPQVLHGYLNDPEATASALTADGFLLTGDAGWIDPDGNVRITDRLKDMYLVGGFNTYPAEIEQYLCQMPQVAQAAVIGVDDDRLGQVGHAYIVRTPGVMLDADTIVAACKRDLANYKVPRAVHVVDALPMNATGKVDKKILRAQHGASPPV